MVARVRNVGPPAVCTSLGRANVHIASSLRRGLRRSGQFGECHAPNWTVWGATCYVGTLCHREGLGIESHRFRLVLASASCPIARALVPRASLVLGESRTAA